MTFIPGIYSIFKPKGITSHDVIDKIRRLSGIQRVGHAGTLDPLASGVLVVAVGREFTKQLDSLMKTDKEYLAEITFGKTSTTDDAEGEKTEREVAHISTEKEVQEVLAHWVGEVDQLPPIYSAIKIQGRPAHRRVRQGETVELQPRQVVIFTIDLIKYVWPLLQIKVKCGKGVYIRSLARDIGEELSVGGYMSDLVRTRVGDFTIEDAKKIED
ncbi:MAG: tRNA pseudouridine(55) synthase TruB [Patescibacteria group bacterium]